MLKTVRYRLAFVEELLEQDPGLKVVALFRDPRGFMQSRSLMTGCRLKSCYDTQTACYEMEQDLNASDRYDRMNLKE